MTTLKLEKVNVTVYNMIFSANQYFFKGVQPLYGKIDEKMFLCSAKSGSQSLWLPFMPNVGLKIFHQEGQSDTFTKAKGAFEAQQVLFDEGVAPKPHFMCETALRFELMFDELPVWRHYGVAMSRVKCRVETAEKFLEDLGVKLSPTFVAHLLVYRDFDALSLSDYVLASRFLGVNVEEQIAEKVEKFKKDIPIQYQESIDLLTWSNILVDNDGSLKVVDFDYLKA